MVIWPFVAIFVEQTKRGDMKDIICVDLSALSYEQLEDFSKEKNFKYEVLKDLKNKTYAKIWFTRCGEGIAFTLVKKNIFKIKDYGNIRPFEGFFEDLQKISTYKAPKPLKVLEVDAILDKIAKYGAASMTKEEKEFLDSQSK